MQPDKKQKNRSNAIIWIVSAVVVVVFIGLGAFLVKLIISDDEGKSQRQIQMVTLLKPPPPPKIPEKPPEPEIRKDEIMEQKIEAPKPDEMPDQSQDNKPPGQDLGLDAEGTAGSDGFGLVGKKGGRALIGGGGGSMTGQYAWYTYIVQEEIKKTVRERLEKTGGIPKGKIQIIIRIELDQQGKIIRCDIAGSSGNKIVDNAILDTLAMARVSEPPPDGMPRAMKLRISSQG